MIKVIVGCFLGLVLLPLVQAKDTSFTLLPPKSGQAAPTTSNKVNPPANPAPAVASSKPAPAHSNGATAGLTSTAPTKVAATTKVAASSRPVASSVHSDGDHPSLGARLARLTAYWAGEGDYYTSHALSSTGIHLHNGHCAVDPRIIPYGSVVEIAGLGKYIAVDTGSAVVSREAAKEAGHTAVERAALVIDIFFESRRDGEAFAQAGTRYAQITWTPPHSLASRDGASADKDTL